MVQRESFWSNILSAALRESVWRSWAPYNCIGACRFRARFIPDLLQNVKAIFTFAVKSGKLFLSQGLFVEHTDIFYVFYNDDNFGARSPGLGQVFNWRYAITYDIDDHKICETIVVDVWLSTTCTCHDVCINSTCHRFSPDIPTMVLVCSIILSHDIMTVQIQVKQSAKPTKQTLSCYHLGCWRVWSISLTCCFAMGITDEGYVAVPTVTAHRQVCSRVWILNNHAFVRGRWGYTTPDNM